MTKTEVRTLDMSIVGNRFREGPVLTDGLAVCSVEAEIDQRGTQKSVASGVASVRGGLSLESLAVFTSDATFGFGAVMHRRLIGDDTLGVSGESMLDGFVTTAEANLILQFTFYLNTTTGA